MAVPRDIAALQRHVVAAGDARLAALLAARVGGRSPPGRSAYATLAARLRIASRSADYDRGR